MMTKSMVKAICARNRHGSSNRQCSDAVITISNNKSDNNNNSYNPDMVQGCQQL